MPETKSAGAGTPVSIPADPIQKRLQFAVIGSLALNALLIQGAAALANRAATIPFNNEPPPIQVSIIDTPKPTITDVTKPAPSPEPIATPAPTPESEHRITPPAPKPVAERLPRPKPVQVAMKPRFEKPIVPVTPPVKVVPPKPVEPPVEKAVIPPPTEDVTPKPDETNRTDLNQVAKAGGGGQQVSNPGAPKAAAPPNQGAVTPTAANLRRPSEAVGQKTAGSGAAGEHKVLVAMGDKSGSPNVGGEFTVPDAMAARPTGPPAARLGTREGLANPNTGGTDPKILGAGAGAATVVAPNWQAARGPVVGLPGAPAGPRNKVLVAMNEKTGPAATDFTYVQGGGVRSGTPLARQGVAGATGVTSDAPLPRFAGAGTGAGTGAAGIAAPTYVPSRGPIGGGGGPIGPRGKTLAAYGGGGDKAGPIGGVENGIPGGTMGGVVGGTGRPGRGPVARGYGGGDGPVGVRLGVRDGSPNGRGASGGTSVGEGGSGGTGRGRGPVGEGSGPEGARKRSLVAPGGGGDKIGDYKPAGDPNGVPGGIPGGTPGGTGRGPGVSARGNGNGGGGGGPVGDGPGVKGGVLGGNAEVSGRRGEAGPKVADKDEPKSLDKTKVTRNAEILSRVRPDIPDDLRSQSFKGTVNARFVIQPNGRFSVSLISRSGNSDVDDKVLEALRDWRWRPAMKDGVNVESTREVEVTFINK